MKRKDIIIASVLLNAGILTVLLVGAITTKENYFIASSAKVAETILTEDVNGMLPKETEEFNVKKEVVATKVVAEDPKNEIVENKIEVKEAQTLEAALAKKEEEINTVLHKLPPISFKEKEEQPKEKENKFVEVTVQKGDNLEKIAKLNNTTISEIIKINDLPNSFLRIGQTLLVPKKAPIKLVKEVRRDLPENYYTVKCGDNPWTIAIKHHLKVDELLKLNNLNNETAKKLRPGDKIKIR